MGLKANGYRAMSAAKNVSQYLENPASMELSKVYAITPKKDLVITDKGRKTDESIELSKLFKRGALITYTVYSASSREWEINRKAGYYRTDETFIQLDGKPIISYGSKGFSETAKEEYVDMFYDLDSLTVRTLNEVLQAEAFRGDVDRLVIMKWDFDKYSNGPAYVISLLMSLVVAFGVTIVYSIHSRRKIAKALPTLYDHAMNMIEIGYPKDLLPQSQGCCKNVTLKRVEAFESLSDIECHVWVEAEKLCIMETKESLKKRAKDSTEGLDCEALIKRSMYMKMFHVGLITEFDFVQGYGYIVRFHEYGSIQTLVFDFDAGEFIESLKEQIRFIGESSKDKAEQPFEDRNGWPVMDLRLESQGGAGNGKRVENRN
ncbi:MAG: hypothetical protein LBT59_06440 [Clostridiales bacterium]|nr:hypothetical protein [Clostridiales bacterium]